MSRKKSRPSVPPVPSIRHELRQAIGAQFAAEPQTQQRERDHLLHELATAQRQIKALDAENARLHAELHRLQTPAEAPRLSPLPPRQPGPDEQSVEWAAEGTVRDTARVLEAYVRRQGGHCSLSDARHHAAAYTCIPQALRHLELSGRVTRVGDTLCAPRKN